MLTPIAIQLERDEQAPVFTPLDPPRIWSLVKSLANSADLHVHWWTYRFMFGAGVLTPIYYAAQCALPSSHPISRLLAPHFQHFPMIQAAEWSEALTGDISKTWMSLEDNATVELMKRFLRSDGSFDKVSPRLQIEKRGTTAIGDYPYREDVMLLWEAIESFTSRIIKHYYREAKDILMDTELNEFLKIIRDDSNLRGLPADGKIETAEDLTALIAPVLYLSSVHYAAVKKKKQKQKQI